MEIKEIIVEALRSLVIPELEAIKTRITVIETRLDGMDKRFEDQAIPTFIFHAYAGLTRKPLERLERLFLFNL
ncbi:MAG: hypothetical protein HZA20_04450 [Nitrospirae bacterium]|nr:hypothetical protein [Nitrospirota bacterium]